MSAQAVVTVCIVSFNTADFIINTLACLAKLTKNHYKVLIRDNNSDESDYVRLNEAVKDLSNVYLYRVETDLRGSMAHAVGVEDLISRVDTPYFSILDADATWLIKDWDEILIDRMTDKIKVIGSEADNILPGQTLSDSKVRDFPLMFAMMLETATYKSLKIDLRPKDVANHKDTGYEMREKYLQAGFQGELITSRSTRIYKDGPFADIICGEYYLPGISHIFASHFGRGSSLGKPKYLRGLKGFIYRLPWVGDYLVQRAGEREKRRWIAICQQIMALQ